MRIGVLSDTHMRSPNRALDRMLTEHLSGVDMILHAGDIVGAAVLEYLESRDVIAVCGNMDDYEIAGAIPGVRELTAGGRRICLIHGWGAKQGLQRRILGRFGGPPPDLVVYGHSHTPFWGTVDGVPMFNPGCSNPMLRDSTVGILEIDEEHMEGHFISLDG